MKEAFRVQTVPIRMRKRSLRMHRSNHFACLICYLVAFAIPAVWQYAAIRLIYPWKLASTAPDIAGHLLEAFPFLGRWLAPFAALTAENAAALRDVLAAREQVWLFALAACALAAWLTTLIIQLIWRFAHRSPLFSSRQTSRAIRSYRVTLLLIWALNAAAAAFLWMYGVQHIAGRTLWDYLASFGVFALIPPSAAFVSRFAASPAISGRHAFFKRI